MQIWEHLLPVAAMAEQATVTADGGAMNSVLSKLSRLLADSSGLPMHVRSKITNLKADLESLHASLLSFSGNQGPKERVRSWLVEAREVSYDIEDILDRELKSDLKLPSPQRFIEQCINLLAVVESRCPISSKIDELFGSPYWGFLFEIKSSPSGSGTGTSAAQGPSRDPPAELVGIDALRDGLVGLLKKKVDDQSGQRLTRVISIVGCRGLGKKTLAKEVHGKLCEEFDCAAFVDMTRDCSTNEILRKILNEVSHHQQLNSKDESNAQNLNSKDDSNAQQLISELRDLLKDKRYLITVGDVHSASSWRIIKEAMPENKRNNRIITTTSINSVANICCPDTGDFVYDMQPLTSTHCKSLFPLNDSDSEEKVKVFYNNIVKTSGYTPLAVTSLASVMVKKESISPFRKKEELIKEWEEVWNSLYTAPGNFQELRERIKILSHSYYELPSNLKACALYLSILPLNHMIDRDWLVRKWIAEGFVHEEMGLGLEEVAKNYLAELIDRNFIQPVDCGNILLAERYQVHFMMLCLLKSISQQEKFVTLVHAPDIQNSQSRISRRLSLFYPTRDYPENEDKVDLRNVRSVNIFGAAARITFQEFSNVRVLDLEGCIVGKANFDDICRMFLLKYLGLKETQVSEIPQQIKNLQHLETLDVTKTEVRKLPKEVVHLKKLVNLLVGDSDTHQGLELPEGSKDWRLLNELRCLRTIDLREYSSSILLEFPELTELRELEIVLSCDGLINKKQSVHDILSFLKKFSKLQSLVIYGDFSCSMDTPLESHLLQKLRVSRRFEKVPKWIGELVFLAQLDIRVCELKDDHLEILRGLPSLRRLIIGLEILPEQPISISNTGFSSLDTFCFDCKMPILRFQQGAMPKLKHLELKFYGGLSTQAPSGTNHLIALRKIVLRYPQGCEENTGIKETIAALKQEADEHVNYISMYRNGTEERFPWKLIDDKGKQKIDE